MPIFPDIYNKFVDYEEEFANLCDSVDDVIRRIARQIDREEDEYDE